MVDYLLKSNGVVDPETGELIDPKIFLKEKYDEAKGILDNLNVVAGEYGIPFRAKLEKYKSKKYFLVYVKSKKGAFQQINQDSVQKLFENKIDIWSKGWIAQFTPYLAFPSNIIILNGKIPSVDDFAEAMNLKRNKMHEILKELKYYDVIHRDYIEDSTVMATYVNPYLYASGTAVEAKTVNLFAKSTFKK